MKPKKIPLRMCLGCQEMKPKKELIRIVKNNQGQVLCDISGKKAGRGAYICKSIDCFQKAKKSKRFEKAFEMTIGEDIFEILLEELRREE